MDKQPQFYSLDFFSDANFWTEGDASTRRVFIMPLPEPSEFLGFGVLAPSNDVLFVARGQVLNHLGKFIARMEQAEARVELYARPPLPGGILNEYVKGKPHEQKETEDPPDPPPNFHEQVILRDSPTTVYSLSGVSSLWPNTSAPRLVVVLPVPGSDERVAFGLFEVDSVDYFWGVAFVAHMESAESEFLGDLVADGITVSHYSESPYTPLKDYMDLHFPGNLSLAA